MNERDRIDDSDGWAGPWLLLLAVLLIPLAVHAYLGAFSRYVADDYCTAANTKVLGFWASQKYWYVNWTGRYAYNATLSLLELMGPWVVQLLPAMALIAWTIVLAWTLRGSLPGWLLGTFPSRTYLPIALSAMTMGLTLAATPDVYQSVYWQTGLVNYTLPILLLTLQAGILARASGRNAPSGAGPRVWLPLTIAILALVSAAFSETYLIGQTLLYLGAAAWFFLLRRPSPSLLGRRVVAIGFGGTLLGAAIVILAPGNAVRASLMPEPPPGLVVLLESLRFGAAFSAKAFLAAPVGYLLSAALAIGLGIHLASRAPGELAFTLRQVVRGGLLVGAAGGILIVSLMIPSAYATSAYPVDRALIAPTYLSALVVEAAGVMAGFMVAANRRAPSRGSPARTSILVSQVLAAAFAAWGTRESLTIAGDLRDYAWQWDRRQVVVEAAERDGVRSLVVNPLPHIASLPELEDDPLNWLNQCFAQYHGFEAVMAE